MGLPLDQVYWGFRPLTSGSGRELNVGTGSTSANAKLHLLLWDVPCKVRDQVLVQVGGLKQDVGV